MPLPSEGFLLEYAPGRLLLGEGPLRHRATAPSDRPSCFAPDFYLQDPTPWVEAARVVELTSDQVRRMLPPGPPPRVQWTEPDAGCLTTETLAKTPASASRARGSVGGC